MKYLLLLSLLLLSCKSPGITASGVKITAPQNAGTPATLITNDNVSSVTVPEAVPIEVTKTSESPATPATSDTPAVPFKPATEVIKFVLPAATVITETAKSVQAATGTVDVSVAKHKIDAEENRWLLLGAGIALGAGLICHFIAYPGPEKLCYVAAGILFLAWKVSGLPTWIWGVAVALAALGAGIYFGFEKRDKSPAPQPKAPTTNGVS